MLNFTTLLGVLLFQGQSNFGQKMNPQLYVVNSIVLHKHVHVEFNTMLCTLPYYVWYN